MLRPVPHPDRRRPTLLIAVLVYAVVLSFILFAMLVTRCSPQAQGASQVPDLTPETEESIYAKQIAGWGKIGELLPSVDLDERRAVRRRWAGDQACSLITMLANSDRLRFEAIIELGCACLRRWWPEKAAHCQPCQN